jgi:DNA-binding NarL/FixJ family response regulator
LTEVQSTADFLRACSALADAPWTQLLVIDSDLPGMNEIQGIARLRASYADLKIIVSAENPDRALVLEALAVGIHGVISKQMSAEAMEDAFRQVLAGHVFVPDEMAQMPTASVTPEQGTVALGGEGLTARQRDVVRLVRQGMTNKEIARELNIAESTVKVHVAAAFRHLGVHNRVGAVRKFETLAVEVSNMPGTLPSAANLRRRASDWQQPDLSSFQR